MESTKYEFLIESVNTSSSGTKKSSTVHSEKTSPYPDYTHSSSNLEGTDSSNGYETHSFMYIQAMVKYEEVLSSERVQVVDKNALLEFLENYGNES